MEGLEAALRSLEFLASINYRATALKFKCGETTLRHRHQWKQHSTRDATFNHKTRLSEQQELDLIAYIIKLKARSLPPTV
jgi:hypothetical protein